MSSSQPSTPTLNTGTHAINGRLGSGDGEAQNTTLTDSETDNINEQAEHGNRSARNTAHGGAPQRRRMPITLAIPTLPRMTATDGQELGLDGSATGNGMLQNAPSEPTRDAIMDNPDSFGVPRTNHFYLSRTIPPCPSNADNFESFGISQAANFTHFGNPTSELCPMQHSTPPRTTTALSSHPPAGENDAGVSDGSVVLRDFSLDLDEWRRTPDGEEHGNGSQRENSLAQEDRTTPTNEIPSLNVGDLRLGTPTPGRLAVLELFSQYPENEASGAAPGEHTSASNQANLTNPVRRRGLAALAENEHAHHGDGRAMARPNTPIQPQTSDALTPYDLTSHYPERRASNAASAEGSTPNGQTNPISNSPEPAGHRSTTPPTRNDDVVNRNRRAPRDVVPSLRRV